MGLIVAGDKHRGRCAQPPTKEEWLAAAGVWYACIPEAGCWMWMRAVGRDGYGKIKVSKRQMGAHRASYELFKGAIPDGMDLDHLCRNRTCVNPDHLEAVSERVNVVRGMSPVGMNSRKTHCKRGHPFDEENTLRVPAGRQCKTCIRMRAKGLI